eukprot:2907046-Ditylum_brightwellii.AAC.1
MLQELHMCCLQAKLMNKPITGIFLELYLQCNGTTLLDKFLNKLAELSKQHVFNIAVDEVLTGGRYAECLKTLKKPTSFIERGSYICLGKWMEMGMVFCNAELYNEYIRIGMGETTGTNYNEVIKALNQVIMNLDKITEQREKVLKMLKCDKSEAWCD